MYLHTITYEGRKYMLLGSPRLATIEETSFYLEHINKRAVFVGNEVRFPRLFGVPEWSHVLETEEEASSPLGGDEEEENGLAFKHIPSGFIYCSNIAPRNFSQPQLKITKYEVHLRKCNAGFELQLTVFGEELRTFVPSDMSWEEFALYLDFALKHGKVYFRPLLNELTIQPCLGIHSLFSKLH